MSESKYGPQGKMALWRSEPGKKQVFQGNIELSPDLIEEIINQYQGNPMKLNLIGFKSNSDHPKAPAYSGFASLSTYAGNDNPQPRPPAPEARPAQEYSNQPGGAPDYEEIPFNRFGDELNWGA